MKKILPADRPFLQHTISFIDRPLAYPITEEQIITTNPVEPEQIPASQGVMRVNESSPGYADESIIHELVDVKRPGVCFAWRTAPKEGMIECFDRPVLPQPQIARFVEAEKKRIEESLENASDYLKAVGKTKATTDGEQELLNYVWEKSHRSLWGIIDEKGQRIRPAALEEVVIPTPPCRWEIELPEKPLPSAVMPPEMTKALEYIEQLEPDPVEVHRLWREREEQKEVERKRRKRAEEIAAEREEIEAIYSEALKERRKEMKRWDELAFERDRLLTRLMPGIELPIREILPPLSMLEREVLRLSRKLKRLARETAIELGAK